MSSFEETFAQIRQEQEELDDRMSKVRKEAIRHIQNIVDQFGIKSTDIQFYDSDYVVPVKKVRKPTVAKYRLPSGVEWSGKGLMKREFEVYLKENGLTKDDLDQFLIQ